MATAARIEVPPLIPFDPISEPTSVNQRWKAWKRRFEIYLIAVNVKDDAQKRALLLYQAGEATQEIFDTLEEEEEILDELNDSDNEINVERNNADGLNNGELVDRRHPLRDRRPIYRYGQNIYS